MKKILLPILLLFCIKMQGQASVYANDGSASYLTTMGYVNGNLIVNGELNITPTGDIDVDGNVNASGPNSKLQMYSVSNEFSNLMIGGSANGKATYFRFVNRWNNTSGTTTTHNDLVSAPFTNASQTFGVFRAVPMNAANIPSGTIGGVPSWLFGPFDNNIAQGTGNGPYVVWNAGNDAEVIVAGVGYRTGTTNIANGGDTLSFTGDMLVGNVTVPISIGSAYPWNLIGNPYSTYINCGDFLTENAAVLDENAVGIYGYDGTAEAGAGDWTVINFNNSNESTNMAPGQGFMVMAEGSNNITFTPAMRRMGSGDDFISGRTFDNKYFRLHMQGNVNQSYSDFYFNNNSTRSLDPGYDARLFFGSQTNFYLYSHLVEDNMNIPMVMQSLPANDYQEDVLIPLGVEAQSGDELTFSISESTLPVGTNVYLFDNETSNVTDISNSNYTVQLTTDLSGIGRFYINFNNTTLGLEENQLNSLNMYVEQNINHLVISSQLNEKTDVGIFDINGRQVLEREITLNSNVASKINLSHLSSGFYIARVKLKGNGQIVKTKKIILN
jgi:hypothetical protein